MKKIYGKDTDSQTGEVTEHLWQHYDYVWKDGVIDSAKIIVYDEHTYEVSAAESIKYLYDSEKTPVGMIFTDPNDNTNDLKAWYIKDLQGDITGVYIEGIGVSLRYAYDAFGKIEVIGGDIPGLEGAIFAMIMTVINPITYRGYSFDMESYTYYLQSRYYDPQIGRFLNADDTDYINSDNTPVSSNIFAYCVNNPVMFVDYTGCAPWLYYFYGKDQKSHAESNISELTKKYSVSRYYIASTNDFTNYWNKLSSPADIVIINLHGNPTSVLYMDLKKLQRKQIDTLILLSCNAGHQKTGNVNFAKKLFEHSNIRQLIACDGTHKRGPGRAISVIDDEVYKSYIPLSMRSVINKNLLASSGFVRYLTNRPPSYSISSIGYKFNSVADLLKKIGKW